MPRPTYPPHIYDALLERCRNPRPMFLGAEAHERIARLHRLFLDVDLSNFHPAFLSRWEPLDWNDGNACVVYTDRSFVGSTGYPRFRLSLDGRTYAFGTHVVSYACAHQWNPYHEDGFHVVRHQCVARPDCVNPRTTHLIDGTDYDNILDQVRDGTFALIDPARIGAARCARHNIPFTQYPSGPQCKACNRQAVRARIANDPEYRERRNRERTDAQRERYQTDPEYRARELAYERERYANDPEARAKKNARSRAYRASKKAEREGSPDA